ncbi:WAT1-related protein At1g70260 [Euphorbia lathyris]|uniref:WAT1-related protein At1g70260 n=1 Tax=Euphorbia lathyris TaxID=212925 RepID=UPI003313C6B7
MVGVMISSKMGDALPFVIMVIMEGCTIGLTILAKTAMSGGMSPFVFVVYTNALSTLFLFPFSFFFHRHERVEQSLFTFPLFLRFCFLGFTGVALSQNLAFLGLNYSSPIVVCAMGLLIPSFSFFLSIFLRKTELKWRRSSFQSKVIGSLISMVGAFLVAFYKGPFVRNDSSSSFSKLYHKQHLFVFYSTPDHWLLGCFLLAASFLCVSVWNIIQLGTMKEYPQLQVMKVACFYSFAGTIQSAIFSFILLRDDFDAWKLHFNMDLLLILFTAIFGSVVRSSVQICFGRKRGPFYVPLFQPFRIFWACFFGITFFANSLHYGSVIGTVICGMGYYTVMWGQTKQDQKPINDVEKSDSSDEKVPLLLQQDDDQVV